VEVALPDISNNVGSVNSFLSTPVSVHSEEWSSRFFFDLCINNHGSFVIFRSVFSPT
jgi:hypothetical protein